MYYICLRAHKRNLHRRICTYQFHHRIQNILQVMVKHKVYNLHYAYYSKACKSYQDNFDWKMKVSRDNLKRSGSI